MADHPRPLLILALAALASTAGCGGAGPGVEEFRAGRTAEALAALVAAEREDGDRASAALLHDLAVVALRAGDLPLARLAARRAAATGEPAGAAVEEFVLGCEAWTACDAAESESLRAPRAFDRAIEAAELARRHWGRAAATGGDLPEAGRNAERAALRVRRLRADRDLRDRAKGKATSPPPGAVPVAIDPKADAAPPPPKPDAADRGGTAELPRDEVLGLLDRLSRMEREKIDGRRQRREARHGSAERDW